MIPTPSQSPEDRTLRIVLRTMAVALVAVLVVALLSLPAAAHHEADPSAPRDFRNAEPTTFGQARLDAYTVPAAPGEAVPLLVPLTLHPEQLTRPAERYLVGFNLHVDDVRLGDVTLTQGGKPVPFERDETDRPLQPRFILAAADLPRDKPLQLELSGMATASRDGQLHVGVLAIAFDAGWATLRTRDGQPAEAYAFTLLMAEGHAGPFVGSGHSLLAWVPVLGLVGAATAGLLPIWVPQGLLPKRAQASSAGPVTRPPATPRPAMAPVPPRSPQQVAPRPMVSPPTRLAPTRAAQPAAWPAGKPIARPTVPPLVEWSSEAPVVSRPAANPRPEAARSASTRPAPPIRSPTKATSANRKDGPTSISGTATAANGKAATASPRTPATRSVAHGAPAHAAPKPPRIR